MELKNRKLKVALYLSIDLLVSLVSMLIPYVLRYNPHLFLRPIDFPVLYGYMRIYLFGTVITILLLSLFGLYRTNRAQSYFDEAFQVCKATFFSFLPAAGAVFFLQQKQVSRLVVGVNWVTLTLLLVLWRVMKRAWVRRRVAKGYNNVNVLILGAGHLGELVAREMLRLPHLGLRLEGFLDDHRKITPLRGVPILGRLTDLDGILQQKYIDEVYVTVSHDENLMKKLYYRVSRFGASLKVIPGMSDTVQNIQVSNLGFLPVLQYSQRSIHGTEVLAKRAFDLVVSLIGLLFLSPLFYVIAMAIKLDSKGPVFYVSKRCGRKKKVFNFYKFRTMIVGADLQLKTLARLNEKDGPIFKMKNDPRVTRVGKFLRRYSLDELPQLWNVFKGEMSLVGPRPPVPDEVRQYEDWELRRLGIRPGITCLAQVRGRSDISFKRWMKWDIFYIENWSFALDLKILVQTLIAVLKGKGAY